MTFTPSKQLSETVTYQRSLYQTSEVFVYRLPPLTSSCGHRAESWNLSNPLATCSLNILQHAHTLSIHFYKSCTSQPQLFCTSIIKIPQQDKRLCYFFEPVVDSSRYFVLRINNPTSKRDAFIGVGFRDRDTAQNVLMVLQDYERGKIKELLAEQSQSDYVGSEKYKLKQGEKIHVRIEKKKKGKKCKRRPSLGSSSDLCNIVEKIKGNENSKNGQIENIENDENDEWSDFQSSEVDS